MWTIIFNDLLAMSNFNKTSIYLHTIFRPKAALSFQLRNDGKFFIRAVEGNPNVARDSRGFVQKGAKVYDESTAVRMSLDIAEVSKLAAFFSYIVRLVQAGKYSADNVISVMDNLQMPFHEFRANSFKLMHSFTDNNNAAIRKEFVVSVTEDGKLYLGITMAVNGAQQRYMAVGLTPTSEDLFVISSLLDNLPLVMSGLSAYYKEITKMQKVETQQQQRTAVNSNTNFGQQYDIY